MNPFISICNPAAQLLFRFFFQLPFSPFIPDDGGFNKQSEETTNKNSLLSKMRMTTEKKKDLPRARASYYRRNKYGSL